MSTPSFDGFSLAPRRGVTLQVLIVCRISTEHQDARSLGDQEALCRRHVAQSYPGPAEFKVIAGRGSGEHLDRADLLQAEEEVESKRYDLVVVEDLGRICRRNRALDFCELCLDAGTRLVAINDSLDTAREDWNLNALVASFKHESGNKDTAKRIRRSLRNRFEQGGVVQTLPYGYRKPPGAASDAEIEKLPGAEAVIETVFAMLESGASFSEVADRLNADGVPVGDWVRLPKWDSRVVGRLVRNPILKGVRRRNVKLTVRVHKTGRRKAVNAPPGERLTRDCPHLAFVDPDRYDALIAKLAAANAACARGRSAGAADPRAGAPRKRTAWPGQHARCGVCGRLFYWGGHGQTERMMCSGARDYACWNAATFDGADAARRIAAALLAEVESLPEFDDTFRAGVEATARAADSAREGELRRLDAELSAVGREVENLADAVGRVGYSEALAQKLAEAEARKARAAAARAALLAAPSTTVELPPVEALKARARKRLAGADMRDPAFGRTLSALMPSVELFPVRLIDGGKVELRARLAVALAPLADQGRAGAAPPLPARTVWVDLFDPPQRAEFRERVAALRAAGLTEREVAAELGITQPAVQAAARLQRQMASEGRSDPYALLVNPPEGDGKITRHRHPRYGFAPLPGYPAGPAT